MCVLVIYLELSHLGNFPSVLCLSKLMNTTTLGNLDLSIPDAFTQKRQ